MRRSYPRPLGGVAVMAAAAMIAVGCGARTPAIKLAGNTHKPRVPAITVADPPADPITAALVPKALKEKGSVAVAMDAVSPPDEFTGSDGHSIAGLDAEFAVALGDEMGLKWQPVNAPQAAIMPGLLSGRYGVGMSSFLATTPRPKGIDFVTYFRAGESFYVRGSLASGVISLAGLCGKSVAVLAGTAEQANAVRQGKRCAATGRPAARVQVYASQSAAEHAVASGRADVGFAATQVAIYLVKQSAGALKRSGPAIDAALYVIAVAKASGLAPAILAAIKALTVDGVYTRILGRWGIAGGALTDPVIEKQKAKT